MPKRTNQKRTPFKPAKTMVPFALSCVECHRSLPKGRFIYCGEDCRDESRRKIRKAMKVGEYAKP